MAIYSCEAQPSVKSLRFQSYCSHFPRCLHNCDKRALRSLRTGAPARDFCPLLGSWAFVAGIAIAIPRSIQSTKSPCGLVCFFSEFCWGWIKVPVQQQISSNAPKKLLNLQLLIQDVDKPTTIHLHIHLHRPPPCRKQQGGTNKVLQLTSLFHHTTIGGLAGSAPFSHPFLPSISPCSDLHPSRQCDSENGADQIEWPQLNSWSPRHESRTWHRVEVTQFVWDA